MKSPKRSGDGERGHDRDPHRALAATSSTVLAGLWAIGLFIGWASHRLLDSWLGHPPVIGWSQPAVLLVLALLLAWLGWMTLRVLSPRDPQAVTDGLEPHQAVNRLVLARACALVGALVSGWYFGYAISWIDVDIELADQRLFRSLCAGVAGILVIAASLFLERACRVRSAPPEA